MHVIILSITYPKSQTSNFNIKCSGKRIDGDSQSIYHMPRAILNRDPSSVEKVKAEVLNKLLTQQELKDCYDNNVYGVLKEFDNLFICFDISNVLKYLKYQPNYSGDTTVYTKE